MTAATSHWVALGLAISFNVAANLMLARGMRSVTIEAGWNAVLSILLNGWLWGGGTAAVLLIGTYLYALRGIPVGLAYPAVTGLATVGILLSSHFLLNRQMGFQEVVGVVLVIGGVTLIATVR